MKLKKCWGKKFENLILTHFQIFCVKFNQIEWLNGNRYKLKIYFKLHGDLEKQLIYEISQSVITVL